MIEILDDNSNNEKPKGLRNKWLILPFFLYFSLLFVGAFLKISSWPFGIEIILVATFSYFLSSLILFVIREKKKRNIYFAEYLAFIGLNILVVALLFTIQSWPYAKEMFNVAYTLITLYIILVFVFNRKNKRDF
jgi:peptidoglycan/LPS O-acetylase OafA/YrhL